MHALPEARALASFEFDSLAAAARATVALLRTAPRRWSCSTTWPSAALASFDRLHRLDALRAGRPRSPKAILLVEWSGPEEELDERFAGLEEMAREVGAAP